MGILKNLILSRRPSVCPAYESVRLKGALTVVERMLRYLSADIICSEKRTVIFKVKWRLLCLLYFKYFSQHA